MLHNCFSVKLSDCSTAALRHNNYGLWALSMVYNTRNKSISFLTKATTSFNALVAKI